MDFVNTKPHRGFVGKSSTLSDYNNNNNPVQKTQSYVEIDSLVLIKAIKHCKDNYPVPVNGQLLGLDFGDRLEVTNCFPYPQKRDIYNSIIKDKNTNTLAENEIEEKADEEFVKYQELMTELVHDVRVDCFAIGWYQTVNFGDLQSKDAIDNLVIYQDVVDKAIMLGFDPVSTTGEVSFKAYRASDQLLSVYHSSDPDVRKFNALKGTEILEEVPIVIKNSILSEVFLSQYFSDSLIQNTYVFDVLDAYHNNYLEKNLEFLSQSLEALCDNQEKFIRYQRDYTKLVQQQKQLLERRRLENEQCKLKGEPLLPMPEFDNTLLKKIEAPSQLSTIIMSNECTTHTKDINSLCFDNIAKMYLLYHRLHSKQ
ncbi:eukaryotic translation initiation factor 3, putative [Theileria annulata]|uniref:Eukaryotic translation initiation factor 3 subunit H n=1 Tax=Theileria annulata TaxID=5874 RepID=Q4UE08_THEAN|nr:eukaryotic translation initiation factor 3, putative [Theileria annulata]CAI74681.1 eukaryotic translation initation factor 3, putative [Theileria annulata]|eukprot:XP_952413.1 eukaryotic translation initation factor 3, putative [Theileria annulata]